MKKAKTKRNVVKPLGFAAEDGSGAKVGRAKRFGAGANDVIIIGAMVIIALALSVGLYAQTGLSLGLAVIAGGAALLVMLSLHLLARRIYGLDTRVGILEKRVDKIDGAGATNDDQAVTPLSSKSLDAEPQVALATPELDLPASESPSDLIGQAEVEPELVDEQARAEPDADPQSDTAVEAEGAYLRPVTETSPTLGPSSRVQPNVVDGLVRQLAQELGSRRVEDDDVERNATDDPTEEVHEDRAASEASDADPLMAEAAEEKDSDTEPAMTETAAAELETDAAAEDRSPSLPPSAELPVSDERDGVPAEIIVAAAQRGSVDLYLQPILTLSDRKVAHFEVLPRLRSPSGALILPADYAQVAETCGVITLIDQAILGRTAHVLKKLKAGGQPHAIFCKPSLRALTDPDFLRDFVRFMKGFKDVAGDVVIEVDADTLASNREKLVDDLAVLQRIGIRLSLSDPEDLLSATSLLTALDFSFLRMDAKSLGEFLTADEDGVMTFTERTQGAGVEVIVDHVDDDRALADTVASKASLVQGNLFSEPKPLLPSGQEERTKAA